MIEKQYLSMKSFRILRVFALSALLILIFSTGCEKDFGEQKTTSKYISSDGVFIVSEGTFMAGNGDVSFYNRSDKSISNNLFFSVNNRPPGDIPQNMAFFRTHAYLVVNNSNTIEVIDLEDFSEKITIKGFEMPRQMIVSGSKGYVSQLGSSKIAVINLDNNSVSGNIEGFKSSDRMVVSGKRLFVANWTSYYIDKPNNTIMVFDMETDMFVDSVTVTKEPNSMVVDSEGKIWVLSSGGFMGEEYPAIHCINPVSLQSEKTFQFPSKSGYPTMLTISADGKTLYYADGDIYRMSTVDQGLPQSPFISGDGRALYGLAVDQGNGEIYLSDARDYQQNGKVYRYSASGDLLDSFDAGINPSGIFFLRK